MSAGSRQLKIKIIGDSKSAEETFASVEKSAGGFGEKLGKAGKVAGAALIGVGAAAVAGAALSIKSFVGFENQMNEVFTLLPGITDDAMSDMQKSVLDFSKEFGTLPTEVVPALYNALSAGVPKDNVFEFLEMANKAAVGGVTDLNTAVDAISTVVNAFGSDTISAAEASDLMFTAVRLGKTTFDELGGAISNVAPVAAAVGLDFGDVTAALAALTAQGVPTSVATTQVRGVLSELAKEGTNVDKIFREVAGEGFQDFIAGGGDLQTALQELEGYANDNNLSMIDLFGSIEAGQAALALTGKGTESFTNAMNEMKNSAGATEGAYEQMDKGLQRNIDKILANFEALKLEVGSRLAPVFARFLDFVLNTALPGLLSLADTVRDKLTPAFEYLAGLAGRLKDAFEDGGFTGVLKELPSIFADIGSGILSALGGIDWAGIASTMAGALVTALGAVAGFAGDIASWLWDTVKKINYKGIGESLVSGLLSGVQSVANFATDIATWLYDTFTSIEWMSIGQSIVDGLLTGISAVMDAGQRILGWLSAQFTSVDWSGLGTTIVDGFMTGFNAVTDFGSRAVAWMQAGFQSADWSGIGETISGQIGGAMETIADLGPVQSLIDMFNTHLLPVLQTVGDEISSRVTPTINTFRESLGKVAENISTNLGPTLDNLRGLWESLQPAISKIVPVLQILGMIVGGILIGAFNAFVGLLSGVLPNAVNAAFSIINGLIGIITGLVETVTGVVKIIKGIFTGDWALAWEGAKQVVFGMVQAITSLFSGLWGALKGFIMAVVDGIVGLFQGLYNTVVGNSIIPDMINGIINWFKELPGQLIGLMSDFVASIIGFFTDLATEAIAKAKELLEGVLAAFLTLFIDGPKRIFDTVVAIVSELAKMVTDGVKKAVEFVTGFVEEVAKLITEAPGKIIEMASAIGTEIETLITKALQWGKDFVSGLIQGMKDMLPDLGSIAGTVVSTITDGLGKLPGLSPSPLGIEIGQQFGDGLVAGMSQRLAHVRKTGASVTAALVDGMYAADRLRKEVTKLGADAVKELMVIFANAPEIASTFIDDIVNGMADGSIHVEDAMKLLAMIPEQELIPALERMSDVYQRQIVEAILAGNWRLVASLKETKAEVDELGGSFDGLAKSAGKYTGNHVSGPMAGGGSGSGGGGSFSVGSGGSSSSGGGVGIGQGLPRVYNPETGLWETVDDGSVLLTTPGSGVNPHPPSRSGTIQNTTNVYIDGEPVAQSVNRVNTNALATNMGPV